MRGDISKKKFKTAPKRMTETLAALLADRNGATAIEYALIGGLIGLGIITGVSQVGTSINSFFMGSGSWFSSAESGGGE